MAKRGRGSSSAHRWSFYRAGGVDQVQLDDGESIRHLADLDQKLWVALSCPVKGLEFDERTLALLDTDGDGRVRAPEILAAVKWLEGCLRDIDEIIEPPGAVPLSEIDAKKPDGKKLLASAKHILAALGKGDAKEITIATETVFEQAKCNGDGVVPPDAIDDEATQALAQEIIDCLGGADDRSGKKGIDKDQIEKFFAEADAFLAWNSESETRKDELLPFGDKTAAAFDAVEGVRAKVDDYFARCRLAAFDSRAEAHLMREEASYLEVAAKDLTVSSEEVAHFPLQKVAADGSLTLDQGVNPAWSGKLTHLRDTAVTAVFGKDKKKINEAEWQKLTGLLAAHGKWRAEQKGEAVAKLGTERVQAIVGGNGREALDAAIQADLDVAEEVDAIVEVERLTRYWANLHQLLENFVSFTDFYSGKKSVFQVGTLFLDARSCDLCVRVDDPAKHGQLATMAKTYLAYCNCTRPSGEKLSIAAAFTDGDSDHLFVGRNGVFYDRKGQDWDATITKIVEHPISIRQAFWMPYKRLLRWIEEQVAKRAAAADQASAAKMQSSVGDAASKTAEGKPAEPKKLDIGVVAAIGVAASAATAALGALLQAFFGLGIWMPLGILALILLISGPSMLIAWLKLRQRNLGPILDANGWAVNGRVKVNMPLGRALTDRAELPPGSERSLDDPYAQKRSKWPWIVLVLLLLGGATFTLWKTGHLSKWMDFVPEPENKWLQSWFGEDEAPSSGEGAAGDAIGDVEEAANDAAEAAGDAAEEAADDATEGGDGGP